MMSHWVATLGRRLAALGSMLVLLTACGGGGGGGGGGFLPSDPDGDTTSYTLQLEVVDANGNATSSITATQPATLRVTVLEDTPGGDPVSGAVVAATAEFTVITPENGQALTNADGIATFQLEAGTAVGADTVTVTVESPAGTVTRSVGVQTDFAGLNLGFFDGSTFVNGQIGLSADNLAFGGSAALRIAVVDENGQTAISAEEIRLRSACSLSGRASFRPLGNAEMGTSTLVIETIDGLASAEYLAGSCEGEDELTAELVGGNTTATGSITIAARTANFIGFFSADPAEGEEGSDRTIIALRGTGGPDRPEVATLTFEVLQSAFSVGADEPGPGEEGYLDNAARVPLAGITVNFSLTNSLGGINLLEETAVTDANGLVSVDVRSGNVPTSFFVVASFESSESNGRPLEAISNQVVVSTGVVDQNSFSLSIGRFDGGSGSPGELNEVGDFNIAGAADIDGVIVPLTIRMADKFNNPVPDGTSAVFTTEYGAIDPSCLTGRSNGTRFQRLYPSAPPPLRGTCSVLWISQAPRFPLFNNDLITTTADDGQFNCASHTGSSGPCPDDLGAVRGLRSTVLVTAVGEESFVDSNGNGLYDAGEAFGNLPEAFIDNNEDGVYTPEIGPECPFPSTEEKCVAAGAEEEFVDFNEDGIYTLNIDPNTGEGVYNGTLCPPQGDEVFCSRTLLNVRASTVLTLGSTAANLETLLARKNTTPLTAIDQISEGRTYEIFVADQYNNAPGRGSLLSLRPQGGCNVVGNTEFVVPDLGTDYGAFGVEVAVEGDGEAGRLEIWAANPPIVVSSEENATTTLPGNEFFQIGSYPCFTDAPPDEELSTGG